MAKKVDDLPPELIEAIVEAVPDDSPESLQYVCLVASIFRVPCQKKLLHHLQIAHSILPQTYVTPIGRRHSYEEITAFLDDHPHVALYVTRVTVFFTGQASKWSGPEHKSAAESVLGRLTRIREAEFCAEAFYDAARSFSTAEVFEWSFDILRGHGTLQRLRVKSIANLPADVMCRIFHSAPALEISTTTVADFDSSFSPSPGLSARGAIKTLKLAGNNRLVETLLLRPEFSPLTNSLKNLIVLLGLSVDSQTPNNLSPFALTFLASETLEYIDIAFVGGASIIYRNLLRPDPTACSSNTSAPDSLASFLSAPPARARHNFLDKDQRGAQYLAAAFFSRQRPGRFEHASHNHRYPAPRHWPRR